MLLPRRKIRWSRLPGRRWLATIDDPEDSDDLEQRLLAQVAMLNAMRMQNYSCMCPCCGQKGVGPFVSLFGSGLLWF